MKRHRRHSIGHGLESSKKGLGLLWLASALLWIFFIAILGFILNIGGCALENKEARAEIEADASLSSLVEADAQLDSYLRTDLPARAELFEKLDWLKENRMKSAHITELNKMFNFDRAKEILEKYPEAYEGKDYSGFVSSLYAIYNAPGADKDVRGKVLDAFRAVTAVMFLRAVKDYPKRGEYTFYLLPIGVDLNPAGLGLSGKEDLCDKSDFVLCFRYFPATLVPKMNEEYKETSGDSGDASGKRPARRFSGQAAQAVPAGSSGWVKVEFRYYPELRAWLPQA